MPSRKEPKEDPPSTPQRTRQTTLTGRVLKSTSLTPSQTQIPNQNKKPSKSTPKSTPQKYAKLVAASAASPSPLSSPTPAPSSIFPPASAAASGSQQARKRAGGGKPAANPPKPSTITIDPSNSDHNSNSSSQHKYGPCPKCPTGRRVRSRFKLTGPSPHRGKFRFVCSNRFRHPPGNDDCDYSEVLDRDPLENPAVYRAEAEDLVAAKTLGQQQQILGDDGLEEVQQSRQGREKVTAEMAQGRSRGQGQGSKKGVAAHMEMRKGITTGKQGRGETNTGFDGLDHQGRAAPAGKDKPQQRLGCPQCMKGRLVQKCKDTFRWRERVLVCEQVWNGQEWSGGCGYRLEIENGPNDEEEDGGVGGRIGGGAALKPAGVHRNQGTGLKRQREEEDEWVAARMEQARANPLAAAVVAKPDKSKKVVVDLTEEDQQLGASSQTLPAASMMVGGKDVIYVDDDESTGAAGFDELDSADELELVEMADRAADDLDELDEEAELELMRLADRASASLSSQ